MMSSELQKAIIYYRTVIMPAKHGSSGSYADDDDEDTETMICPQCGDTAFMNDDGTYTCVECGWES